MTEYQDTRISVVSGEEKKNLQLVSGGRYKFYMSRGEITYISGSQQTCVEPHILVKTNEHYRLYVKLSESMILICQDGENWTECDYASVVVFVVENDAFTIGLKTGDRFRLIVPAIRKIFIDTRTDYMPVAFPVNTANAQAVNVYSGETIGLTVNQGQRYLIHGSTNAPVQFLPGELRITFGAEVVRAPPIIRENRETFCIRRGYTYLIVITGDEVKKIISNSRNDVYDIDSDDVEPTKCVINLLSTDWNYHMRADEDENLVFQIYGTKTVSSKVCVKCRNKDDGIADVLPIEPGFNAYYILQHKQSKFSVRPKEIPLKQKLPKETILVCFGQWETVEVEAGKEKVVMIDGTRNYGKILNPAVVHFTRRSDEVSAGQTVRQTSVTKVPRVPEGRTDSGDKRQRVR